MSIGLYKIYNRKRNIWNKPYMTNTTEVKKILIKHNALHLDIDQIDDSDSDV